jgi:phage-related holin
MGITLWTVTFTAVKKTISRLLLLIVSMSYGVVLPTLGGITSRVAALGLVYFVASEALELVENLGNINDFSSILKKIQIYNIKILVYHIVSHKYKGDNISIFNYLSPEKHN